MARLSLMVYIFNNIPVKMSLFWHRDLFYFALDASKTNDVFFYTSLNNELMTYCTFNSSTNMLLLFPI